MTTRRTYHAPQRPYGPIDALNRRAAALGSPRYAAGAALASYNGHHVTVDWNSYRRYYVAGYTWAGRWVLARGSFADCLRAALREYHRGALGSSVAVAVRDDDTEAAALCEATPDLRPGEYTAKPDWYTWRHECAAASARDSANPGASCMIFDWELLQSARTRDEYHVALRRKYGRVYQ